MMNIDKFLENPSKNCILESDYQWMVDEPVMLGIDEAGRGPALGPMVYGTAFYPLKLKDEMSKMEFADSKQLTEEKRDKLFEKMCGKLQDKIGWSVDILSPNLISNSMLKRSKYNLNELSHDTAIGLIRRVIDAGVLVKEVYVDTVGPPEKYEAKLKKLFPGVKIKVAKKADSLYPVVSAASICAKVIRDKCITDWKFVEKLDDELISFNYGSGYPGDPKTKEFLRLSMDKVFGFPSFIRFGWSTAYSILDKDAIPCNFEEEEDEEDTENTPSVTNFFKKQTIQPTSNKFFTKYSMKRVTNFK